VRPLLGAGVSAGVLAGFLAGVLALASCSSADSSATGAPEPTVAPSSPVKTLTMLPAPSPILSGELTAELQQSSRDVALGRFQVWITNGLDHAVRPRRIVYHDELLTRPVVGGRLRTIPSGSYRGFTLALIEPTCGRKEKGATVTVDDGHEVTTLPVEDETGVVQRWSQQRCAELAVDKVASLEWSPGMQVQGSGADAVALLRLTARPTGAGGSYTVDTVTGTPLFTSADGDFWSVGRKIRGSGGEVTMELPAQPARCDAHAFGAATGGTTFLVNVTLEGGRPAQVRLAMSPEVSAELIAYAGQVCGWGP
jgi:hypothetical protein